MKHGGNDQNRRGRHPDGHHDRCHRRRFRECRDPHVDALDITEINGNPMNTETVVTLELRRLVRASRRPAERW